MSTRPRVVEWLLRAGLLAGSLIVVSIGLEIYLHKTHDLEFFFLPLQFEPKVASEGWERMFVRDYGNLRRQGVLVGDLLGHVHDPELGWDYLDRVRTVRSYTIAKPAGVFRIVAIGDSYTYGAEVEADQSYPYYLEQEIAHGEVINMGVKAYGIDQAVLKYLKYGRAYRPDVLVFGVFGPDYVRTPLSFYRFSKPLFKLDDARTIRLTNIPIPPVETVYRQLRGKHWPLSYLFSLSRLAYHAKLDAIAHEDYFREWDPLIEKIFMKLLDAATQDGTEVIFIYIPTGDQLTSDAARGNYCCERGSLMRIWKKLAEEYSRIKVIDLLEELPKKYSRELVHDKMIFYHGGHPIGHFTPVGNLAVAELIQDQLHRRSR
jgi:hypothetical protein